MWTWLLTTLGQVMIQIPPVRQVLDRVGHLLCFLDRFVKLPTQSSVENSAGDNLF